MRRFPVPLVVVLSFGLSSLAFTQGAPPGGVQGGLPGAPAPGLPRPGAAPARDGAAAPQTGTGKIRGRVLAQGGTPLRRAQLSLTMVEGGAQFRRAAITDGEGRYEFLELPAGRFNVTAIKTGYVTLQYGQRRPLEAGTPVSLAAAQTAERIDLTLPKGSVISVRISDEFGEPLGGAQVEVQRFQYGPDGQRRLIQVAGGGGPLSGTDDRGEFRAFGLMPGEYVIQGTVRSVLGAGSLSAGDGGDGFSPTYYPGTVSSADAEVIRVGVGEEKAVQFAMVASRLARISGRVTDSQGRPAAGAQLTVVTTRINGFSSSPAGTVSADGSFVVAGVSPGEHQLRIQAGRAGESRESALVPIAVAGADIQGLQIVTGPGATVTGQLVWEGTSPRSAGPAPLALRIRAQPADPMLASLGTGLGNLNADGTPDGDGNFTLAGVSGRVFFGMPAVPTGWVIKSVTHDGEDITDVPLDTTGRTAVSDVRIVLTDKQTTIGGQVVDAKGQPLRDYVVIVQPAEQKEPIVAGRLIRVVRPDNTGRFETRGMRPGRYVAIAIEALEQGRQFSPEFQKELRQGARQFTLEEGQAVTVDLRLTPGL